MRLALCAFAGLILVMGVTLREASAEGHLSPRSSFGEERQAPPSASKDDSGVQRNQDLGSKETIPVSRCEWTMSAMVSFARADEFHDAFLILKALTTQSVFSPDNVRTLSARTGLNESRVRSVVMELEKSGLVIATNNFPGTLPQRILLTVKPSQIEIAHALIRHQLEARLQRAESEEIARAKGLLIWLLTQRELPARSFTAQLATHQSDDQFRRSLEILEAKNFILCSHGYLLHDDIRRITLSLRPSTYPEAVAWAKTTD